MGSLSNGARIHLSSVFGQLTSSSTNTVISVRTSGMARTICRLLLGLGILRSWILVRDAGILFNIRSALALLASIVTRKIWYGSFSRMVRMVSSSSSPQPDKEGIMMDTSWEVNVGFSGGGMGRNVHTANRFTTSRRYRYTLIANGKLAMHKTKADLTGRIFHTHNNSLNAKRYVNSNVIMMAFFLPFSSVHKLQYQKNSFVSLAPGWDIIFFPSALVISSTSFFPTEKERKKNSRPSRYLNLEVCSDNSWGPLATSFFFFSWREGGGCLCKQRWSKTTTRAATRTGYK